MSGREKAYYDMASAAVSFMNTVPFLHFYSPDRLTGPAVEAHYVTAAFKAGADWQREQHGTYNDGYAQGRQCGPDYAPLPGTNAEIIEKLDAAHNGLHTNIQGLGNQSAQNYRNLMAMLEQINKVAVEAKAESHTRLGAFHQIMERIEGKVDAVLDQVTPKDVAEGFITSEPAKKHRENSKPLTESENLTSFVPLDEVTRIHGYGAWPAYRAEREPDRMGSEGKGGPVYTSTSENKSKWFREPVTDESGISVGAGAGPRT